MSTERRISVLHFTNEPVRGGAEEHLLMLLTQLDRARFRPLLAAPAELIELLRPDLPRDVETIPITLRRVRDLAAAARFVRMLTAQRIDILHSHMFQASKFASPLGWLARVPVIVETTHVREQWRRGWLKGSYLADRFVGRFITRYIAVSLANADYLEHEKRLPVGKIAVIRNGVAVERFDPGRVAPAAMRAALGIEEDAPVVIVLARFEPQKGHAVLFDAWQSVAASFPKARLVCVGEGRLRGELEARAAALGIAASIRFAGYQSNIPDWLALAAFTVLPSFYEGLPLSALESMAAGRAVVATSVDGTIEVVLDGKTGLTVPAGEPAPLAAAIGRLLAAPELARSLGRAGRHLVEEQFSRQRQIAETETLYLDAWHRRATTGMATISSTAAAAADPRPLQSKT
jgi:glycosyltransferase involved in cell wall biosynthesis